MRATSHHLKCETTIITANYSGSFDGYGCIIIPGGFAYGDHLRPGSLARAAPVISSICAASEQGKPIIGVCNGFQILTEIGLLPGRLLRNRNINFICKAVPLEVQSNSSMFAGAYEVGQTLHLPIAHGNGNYYCNSNELSQLEKNKQILLKYAQDYNGSTANIAAITNKNGNVLGMMPHPERALEAVLGSCDGLPLFAQILNA